MPFGFILVSGAPLIKIFTVQSYGIGLPNFVKKKMHLFFLHLYCFLQQIDSIYSCCAILHL